MPPTLPSPSVLDDPHRTALEYPTRLLSVKGRNDAADIDRKADIVRAGVRTSAAGGGAYLTRLFGPAAAAGAAQALADVGDMLVGALAGWEKRRILRTVQRFKDTVDGKTDAGVAPRPEIVDPNNPRAAELFEAVVEAAARSIEEKKCDVIANFYAAVAFDESISIDDALLYLRRIRASSWRQLVALRYFEEDSRTQERELIAAVKANSGARPSELAKSIGVKPAQVHALISKARADKLIVKRGKGYALKA